MSVPFFYGFDAFLHRAPVVLVDVAMHFRIVVLDVRVRTSVFDCAKLVGWLFSLRKNKLSIIVETIIIAVNHIISISRGVSRHRPHLGIPMLLTRHIGVLLLRPPLGILYATHTSH